MINMNIQLFKPEIFPHSKIISGVTQRNIEAFPPHGFSVHPADIYSPETAEHHLNLLATKLNSEALYFKCNKQTHGDRIAVMNYDTKPGEADGIITLEKQLFIFVKLADCTGILIYDPQNEIIAAVHSGWKGTSLNISGKCIRKLKDEFHSSPSELLVYISPAASGSNYEIGQDVAEMFPGFVIPNGNGRYLFDNRNKIFSQLIQEGVKPENIEKSDICSIADKRCHSFRRDRENSGRMAAFIAMKK